MEEFIKYIPFLIPLVIIQFGFMAYVIIDILKKKKTKNFSPLIWIVIVVLLSNLCLGAVLYLIFGRMEAEAKDDDGI